MVRDLEARLEECEETLGAIRRGEIDAVVIGDTATAQRVYTLENADRPYRMLIEQIQEGAVTLSADGTVFYCNQRLAEMLGRPQEQVIGHKLQPFLQADDVHAAIIENPDLEVITPAGGERRKATRLALMTSSR